MSALACLTTASCKISSRRWRIGVWLVWTIVVPLLWYFNSPDFFSKDWWNPVTEFSSSYGLMHQMVPFNLAMLVLACSILGAAVATIDLTGSRLHRLLFMANLPMAALCVMAPVGLAMGLMMLIEIAFGVAAGPAVVFVRGGDAYAWEQATIDPNFMASRGRLFRDYQTAIAFAGDKDAVDGIISYSTDYAAWLAANGKLTEAIDECEYLRTTFTGYAWTTDQQSKLAEVDAMAKVMRGDIKISGVPVIDCRRAFFAAWLCLRQKDHGYQNTGDSNFNYSYTADTAAARAVLPDIALPPGASPWLSYPQLNALPYQWADDLARALPEERGRIRAILARIEGGS